MVKLIFSRVIKKIYFVCNIRRVLFGKNRGFLFSSLFDLNTDMILGFHEPNTFEVFDIFLKEGMVVADIGSNVGYFTRYLSKKVGGRGKVFAFEPVPDTYNRLNANLKRNRLLNVTSVDAAVTDKDEPVHMFLSHTHYMSSLDSAWAGREGGEIMVPGLQLDSFFTQKGLKPDFIKMDIEGGAVYALQGAVNVITKYAPVLLLESHTPEEDLAIGRALSLIPYKVFRVGNRKEVKFLDRNYKDEFGVYGTVLGVPISRMEEFGQWSPHQFQKRRFGQR